MFGVKRFTARMEATTQDSPISCEGRAVSMIQSVSIQKIRVLALALGALGLVALAAVSMAHGGAGAASTSPRETVVVQDATLAQRPLVSTTPTTGGCDAGAYVTGDMAGNASPSAIYATMCGSGH
jgi:hypothetical protein